MSWTYAENPDRKHKRGWNQPIPGFEEVKGEPVGKCPTTITIETAAELLNSGISYSPPRWPHAYPERIYNIYEGHLYRATPTVPGVSYHGFPEHPARAQKLPRALKQQILDSAAAADCKAEVRRCLSGS
jgi:hypothetical protein